MAPHAMADVEITGVTDTTSVVVPDPVLAKNPTHAQFTIEDVLPHRQKTAQSTWGVAAFASADMFKSKGCLTKPKAKDFSHRLTEEAASRKASSLKGAMKYINKDTISLCGGLPSSEYFPFESLSARVPQPLAFSEPEMAASGINVSTGKHDVRDGKSLYDLSIALNYGQSMGPPQLMRYVCEHTEFVHTPKYSDWDCALTIGNTSALEICLRMLCSRGDFILTEEYSFSSAIETILPIGAIPVGVAMDENGMLATHLDEILTDWDESVRGGPKPFVVYFVPTGQNPSGATQSYQRRKDIYAVAEKHDLILLEDEPYYFLQMEPYVSGVVHEIPSPFKPVPVSTFLSSLVPSYLSMDISGRVIRMDSMSKTLAPGSRFGWITAPKQIVERYVRHQEVSTQGPGGFTMVALYNLLEETWGHKGYLEWLMFLRVEYTRRRDIMVNACEKYVPTEVASWTAPAAGMFHWIKVDATQHPGVKAGQCSVGEVEEKVFLAAVAANVLVAKGSWFRAEKDNEVTLGAGAASATAEVNGNLNGHVNGDGYSEEKVDSTDLHFRMTFAAASGEQIIQAVMRFGEALKKEFDISM